MAVNLVANLKPYGVELAYGNALKSLDYSSDAVLFRGLPPVHGNAQGG